MVQEIQTETGHNFNFNQQTLQNQNFVAALHELYTAAFCFQYVPASEAGGLWSGITPAVRQHMILYCRDTAAKCVSSSLGMHHRIVTEEVLRLKEAAQAQNGQQS